LSSQTYDIVLMDVEMPIMDGIEAATHIRNDVQFQNHSPYIIAITAHVLGDSRARFLAAGMDDFISKPVIMSSLSAALKRAIAAISIEADARSKIERQ
jgi:CheY-like chemotaxis protein